LRAKPPVSYRENNSKTEIEEEESLQDFEKEINQEISKLQQLGYRYFNELSTSPENTEGKLIILSSTSGSLLLKTHVLLEPKFTNIDSLDIVVVFDHFLVPKRSFDLNLDPEFWACFPNLNKVILNIIGEKHAYNIDLPFQFDDDDGDTQLTMPSIETLVIHQKSSSPQIIDPEKSLTKIKHLCYYSDDMDYLESIQQHLHSLLFLDVNSLHNKHQNLKLKPKCLSNLIALDSNGNVSFHVYDQPLLKRIWISDRSITSKTIMFPFVNNRPLIYKEKIPIQIWIRIPDAKLLALQISQAQNSEASISTINLCNWLEFCFLFESVTFLIMEQEKDFEKCKLELISALYEPFHQFKIIYKFIDAFSIK
jgi:hypothetical protein